MDERPKTTVSGLFKSKEDMAEIINYLEQKGVAENDISILMPENSKKHQFSIDITTKTPKTTLKGIGIGSLIGAAIGGLILIGVIIIPGTGMVISGPIIGLIVGATIGGIAGSIIGGLVGRKIPEYEAKFNKLSDKEKTNILLVANIEKNQKSETKKQFIKYGAFHVITQ